MLTAREQGVKGGVWFSLIGKVYFPANLLASHGKVAANRDTAGGISYATPTPSLQSMGCPARKPPM